MLDNNFITLMLKMCRIFELNTKSITGKALNMRDQQECANFSKHQDFFGASGAYYDKIIEIIDKEEILSHQHRREIFYKYEQLYNELVCTHIYSNFDKKIITKKYVETAIPAIIALDIYTTFNQNMIKKNGIHFYSHIHTLLLQYDFSDNNAKSKRVSQWVKKHLKNTIEQLHFDPSLDLNEIKNFIDEIKDSPNQKSSTIIQKIKLCQSTVMNSVNIDKALAEECRDKLDKLQIAYTSLNTLLRFEKETGLLPLVARYYREMREGRIYSSHLLSVLRMYLYTFSYQAKLREESSDTIIYYSNVELPKNQRNDTYIAVIHKLKVIIFGNKFSSIHYSGISFNFLFNYLRKNECIPLLTPYTKLGSIIDLIGKNQLEKAYQLTNEILLEELPYGYLKSAIATINLALKIKLQKNTIKNGTLLRIINPILNSQGVYVDFAPSSASSLNNPIITDPNNLTILRAIKIYNTLITTITHNEDDEKIEYYSQTISGLLSEVNTALEKLDDQLHYIDDISSEHFADLIIEQKVLTRRELTQNLIGILNHCTLINCIGCLPVLMKYLKAPDEKQEAIASFMGISKDNELERDVLVETLHIVHKKLDQQANIQ
ncbi:hypothetical protein QN092_14170 [Proteus vulgaris]|uniref:hypothetical protein n=1 Tax=Proteus vulgaris TaxID=585 RepID=UPI0025419238|nr:hypothetical protein [Proteus vulgaris]WIF71113.1 hypothetical protein QN092_14170 [Proteus vulgaris]